MHRSTDPIENVMRRLDDATASDNADAIKERLMNHTEPTRGGPNGVRLLLVFVAMLTLAGGGAFAAVQLGLFDSPIWIETYEDEDGELRERYVDADGTVHADAPLVVSGEDGAAMGTILPADTTVVIDQDGNAFILTADGYTMKRGEDGTASLIAQPHIPLEATETEDGTPAYIAPDDALYIEREDGYYDVVYADGTTFERLESFRSRVTHPDGTVESGWISEGEIYEHDE